MNTKRVLSRLVLVTLLAFFVLSIATAQVGPGESGPYIDQLYYELITQPDAQLTALLTHTVDQGGVPRPADLPTLRAAGFTITKTVRIGYTMFFENNVVYPTSDDDFRKGVHRFIDKSYIVGNIYAPLMDACNFYLPPPSMYVNPDAPTAGYNPGSSPTETGTGTGASYLNEGGFTMGSTPNPAYTGDPNEPWQAPYLRIDPQTGNDLAPVEYNCEPYADGPLGYEMAQFIVGTLNRAGLQVYINPITWEEIVAILINNILDDYQLLTGVGIVWGSKSPDILYDFFRSDQVPLWNCWNYANAEMDDWADVLKGTLDINEFQEAAYEMQEIAARDEPFLPMLLWNMYSAGTGPVGDDPGILALVNYKGIGAANNFWATLFSRKEAPMQSVVRRIMGAEMTNHNPLMANTVPDWNILAPVLGGTIALNPYTLDYWYLGLKEAPLQEIWPGPDNIEGTADDGMKTTIKLREDLLWDSNPSWPVTAADWWFCMEMLKAQNNVRYRSYWQPYYEVDIIDDYTFIEYAQERFIYRFENLDIGFLCPKHIWESWINPTWSYTPPTTGIMPHMIDWDNHHSAWEGYEWTSGSTQGGSQLIGMGAFYYPIGCWQPTYSYINADRNWWGGKVCAGDVDLNQICELPDLSLVLDAQGSFPGHPVWEGPDIAYRVEMLGPAADIAAPAQQIIGAEIGRVITHFGHEWGPGELVE